jgi:TolA-binding protein
VNDYPERDRRRGGDTVSWRLGDLEKRVENLRGRVHSLESSDAANRHLLQEISSLDERMDRFEIQQAKEQGEESGRTKVIAVQAQGLSRREKWAAIIFGALTTLTQCAIFLEGLHH